MYAGEVKRLLPLCVGDDDSDPGECFDFDKPGKLEKTLDAGAADAGDAELCAGRRSRKKDGKREFEPNREETRRLSL